MDQRYQERLLGLRHDGHDHDFRNVDFSSYMVDAHRNPSTNPRADWPNQKNAPSNAVVASPTNHPGQPGTNANSFITHRHPTSLASQQ